MATIINDIDDLQAMENNLGGDYELGGNIDASETAGWNGGAGFDPIGSDANPFTGTLDGKGYTITGLTINRTDRVEVGLFGSLKSGAIISNIKLMAVSIYGEDAMWLIGAIAGWVEDSTIVGCCAVGSVSGEGESGPFSFAGGLVGFMQTGLMQRCYSLCPVSMKIGSAGGLVGVLWNGTIKECFAFGNVTEVPSGYTGDFGGFVAQVGWGGGPRNPLIENCYAMGNVTGADPESVWNCGGFASLFGAGIVKNCYSTGAVNTPAGGFIQIGYGTVQNSFWDKETSGQDESDGGGVGKNTDAMKGQSTFTRAGWDLGGIWGLTEACNSGYPCLLNATPFCTIIVPEARDSNLKDIVTLEAVRNIEMMGMGRFYIDEQGRAVYESRFARSGGG